MNVNTAAGSAKAVPTEPQQTMVAEASVTQAPASKAAPVTASMAADPVELAKAFTAPSRQRRRAPSPGASAVAKPAARAAVKAAAKSTTKTVSKTAGKNAIKTAMKPATKAVADVATKTAAKPASKPKATSAVKAVAKPMPSKPASKAVKPVVIPVVKPVAKANKPIAVEVPSRTTALAAKAPPAVKPVDKRVDKPAKPPKLVRDSFTMPKDDFDLIEALKKRALEFKRPTKKSELLRAGLRALAALSPSQLAKALGQLPLLKPGRPKKAV